MVHADDVRASIKVCMFRPIRYRGRHADRIDRGRSPFLTAKGWQGDPNSFVTWWRRTHFENSMIDALLHREHTSYREVGHRSVAFVLERAGISYTLDEAHDLVAHIERLRPFPEVPEALGSITNASSSGGSLQWRSGHAGNSEALSRNSLRPRYLGRGCQCLQATFRNVHKSSGNRGSPAWTRYSSSPITPSIASALNLRECEQPSSIGGGDPLGSHRISPI